MISIIAAIDKYNTIGVNGDIPWNCPEDLKFFKEKTTGHPIVMGRKTFSSINEKPLPNRLNVVITSQDKKDKENLIFCKSPEECIEKLQITKENIFSEKDEIFIIGGESIYLWFISNSIARRCYINIIEEEIEIDDNDKISYFPQLHSDKWQLISGKGDGKLVKTVWERIS